MKRYLDALVQQDLERKLVFLTGPRQVGKTTLSQDLQRVSPPSQYFNFDVAQDRAQILRQSWAPETKLLVLDELHKMSDWKQWLKGVIDSRPKGQQILVTGSARMDTFRQSGESLAGRYLSWRLHPLSVKELADQGFKGLTAQALTHDEILTHLLKHGGFPEPCLHLNETQAERWRTQYSTPCASYWNCYGDAWARHCLLPR
jgi:uncharacterized protein